MSNENEKNHTVSGEILHWTILFFSFPISTEERVVKKSIGSLRDR